jgi:hypothetical protein
VRLSEAAVELDGVRAEMERLRKSDGRGAAGARGRITSTP